MCGGALGCDTAAALEVIRFRSGHGGAKLVVAVPCSTQADRWPSGDRRIYRFILEHADDVVVLSENYYPGCMLSRDRYMVDSSSLSLKIMPYVPLIVGVGAGSTVIPS